MANEKNIVNKIINLLEKGKILIFPTDTVYGLVADACNIKAIKKIFKIKKRNAAKPLPFFIADLKAAKKLAKINRFQEKFLNRVWPGRVTAVLETIDGKDTVALRIPDFPLLLRVLKKSKMVLAQTSANISGEPASGKINEILSEFKNQENQPDAAIHAGDLPECQSSTIIDLTKINPRILRNGSVRIKI